MRPGNQNYGKAPCLEKMPPTVPSGLKMGAFQGWWRGCVVVGLALAWEAFGVEGNPSQTRSQAAGCAAALGHQRAPEAGICGLPGSSPPPSRSAPLPCEHPMWQLFGLLRFGGAPAVQCPQEGRSDPKHHRGPPSVARPQGTVCPGAPRFSHLFQGLMGETYSCACSPYVQNPGSPQPNRP